MKNIIKILSIVLFIGIVSTANFSCANSSEKTQLNDKKSEDNSLSTTDIKAYYFHATRRCATCEAVEEISKQTIIESYKETVSFESINREEENDNPLIEKYNINGQTLIFVKGEEVIDLTNIAFMYARTSPEKFKENIKKTIDSLL